MWTNPDRLVAAGPSVNPDRWAAMFEEMIARIASRFTRVEPRRRAQTLLLGLLSDLPDKNCRTISEHAGDNTPDGIQHLLRKAVWDADKIRDDLPAPAETVGHSGLLPRCETPRLIVRELEPDFRSVICTGRKAASRSCAARSIRSRALASQ